MYITHFWWRYRGIHLAIKLKRFGFFDPVTGLTGYNAVLTPLHLHKCDCLFPRLDLCPQTLRDSVKLWRNQTFQSQLPLNLVLNLFKKFFFFLSNQFIEGVGLALLKNMFNEVVQFKLLWQNSRIPGDYVFIPGALSLEQFITEFKYFKKLTQVIGKI